MPKLHAYKKFPYTAAVFGFRVTSDPSGGEVRTYYFLRNITLDVLQDDYGRVLCFFRDSEEDLKPAVRLASLKGSNGTELYPGGVWTLNTFEPHITSMDTREGFRGRADLTHEDGS